MTQPSLTRHAESKTSDRRLAAHRPLVSEGQSAASRTRQVERGDKMENEMDVARQLIATFDNPYGDFQQRVAAAEELAGLVSLPDSVQVEVLIENGRRYVQRMSCEDADAYAPSAFDVMTMAGNRDGRILQFLEETVKAEWGIARWSAIRVLCSFNDPSSDRILQDVVLERYPPKFLELELDLRVIESLRGEEFVARLRGARSQNCETIL